MEFSELLVHHRKRGVPVLAVTTADQVECARSIARIMHQSGDKDSSDKMKRPPSIIEYDCVSGMHGVRFSGEEGVITSNGEGAIGATTPPEHLASALKNKARANPTAAVDIARYAPPNSVVIIHNAPDWLAATGASFSQAIQNLRNEFKETRRILILLGSYFRLPINLTNDVVIIDEPIPDRDKCREIVEYVANGFGFEGHTVSDAEIDAIHGLPAFQAEQALSLSGTEGGFDIPTAWRLKNQLIENTRGLSVWKGNDNFTSIGGLHGVKEYFTRLFSGPRPPQVVVWLDEIEKSAVAKTGDTNGINSDMLGVLLSHMEDSNTMGACLVGVPGTGKSQLVKSIGGEFNRLVIRLDISGCKGSYVGESETNIRAALRLISAVGGGNAIFVATSNSIAELDVALQSRFADTFFFGLPTKEELKPIWEIHQSKYEITDKKRPSDAQWVGRNVKHCVEKAYRMNMSLVEASKYVIPVGQSLGDEITKLMNSAKGKYLCATTGDIM